MHITLSPMRRDDRLALALSGDVLTMNGEAFDFSGIPEGATLPADAVECAWLGSDVERVDGRLHLTLILPHGPGAPRETLFPAVLTDPPDGPITLPPPNPEEPEHAEG